MRRIGDVTDHIELLIHAVDEIDVGSAADAVHGFRAICAAPAKGMRRAVFRTTISLSFDDDTGNPPASGVGYHQLLAQQITSDFEHVRTCVELARKLY